MSDISPSRLGEKADAEFEKLVSQCNTADEIKMLYADKAVRDGIVVRDRYDPSVLLATDRVAPPMKVSKSITVEGKKFFFEGETEADVESRITAYLQSRTQPIETIDASLENPRDERGRFVSENDAAAKAELELQFKRGDISTADYLEQSGAIDSYLEGQGVSLDDVKKVSDEGYQRDWESATREFVNSPEGADWQGGNENLKEIGETLIAMHLDRVPSVESLERAYQDMKRRSAVAENPELTAQREIHDKMANAQSVEEIRQAASSLFGRR